MREKKYYLINVALWLSVLAMILALIYEVGAWVVHHWDFPGLP